jgi:hypothetical protein
MRSIAYCIVVGLFLCWALPKIRAMLKELGEGFIAIVEDAHDQ